MISGQPLRLYSAGWDSSMLQPDDEVLVRHYGAKEYQGQTQSYTWWWWWQRAGGRRERTSDVKDQIGILSMQNIFVWPLYYLL